MKYHSGKCVRTGQIKTLLNIQNERRKRINESDIIVKIFEVNDNFARNLWQNNQI